MDSLSSKHPLLILKQLEQYFSLSTIQDTPTIQSATWIGLAVCFGKFECIIENRHIQEILLPEVLNSLSSVPGAKRWFKGLINLRGQAIPIIDLSEFLTNKTSVISSSSRILLLKLGSFSGGILIDKSLGLKRSDPQENGSANTDNLYNNELPCLKHCLSIDGKLWRILDIDALGKNPDFLNLAMS